MARVLVQRAVGDVSLDDVVLGTSIDLSWWHRWLERLPSEADVEIHGRFLWYRAGPSTGTFPLPAKGPGADSTENGH